MLLAREQRHGFGRQLPSCLGQVSVCKYFYKGIHAFACGPAQGFVTDFYHFGCLFGKTMVQSYKIKEKERNFHIEKEKLHLEETVFVYFCQQLTNY